MVSFDFECYSSPAWHHSVAVTILSYYTEMETDFQLDNSWIDCKSVDWMHFIDEWGHEAAVMGKSIQH